MLGRVRRVTVTLDVEVRAQSYLPSAIEKGNLSLLFTFNLSFSERFVRPVFSPSSICSSTPLPATMQNPLRRAQAPVPKDPPNDHHRRRGQPHFHSDLEQQQHHRHPDKSAMSTTRAHIVAMSGEFVGTVLFLFFAFGGTQIANTVSADEPTLSRLLFISLSFGFSLATTAWAFYRISGGLFNPAVLFSSAS